VIRIKVRAIHEIGVRYAGWDGHKATHSQGRLGAVKMKTHLALEEIEGLYLVGVNMQRRDLALSSELLDEEEGPARFLPGRLESKEIVVEPKGFSLFRGERYRFPQLHRSLRAHDLSDPRWPRETKVSL
jgi:hypothetical protein